MNRNCVELSYNSSERHNNNERLFKVLIIGDVGVGKSSILQRFVEDVYASTYHATIGVDFKSTRVNLRGESIKLHIWDTAGHERFRCMTSSFYRGAHGIVLVYDVTKFGTFEHIPQWVKDVDIHGCEHTVRILLGNKSDLSSRREVPRDVACRFADSRKMSLFEASAKTGDQIHEALHSLVSGMVDRCEDATTNRRITHSGLASFSLSHSEEAAKVFSSCFC